MCSVVSCGEEVETKSKFGGRTEKLDPKELREADTRRVSRLRAVSVYLLWLLTEHPLWLSVLFNISFALPS